MSEELCFRSQDLFTLFVMFVTLQNLKYVGSRGCSHIISQLGY